MVMSAAYHFDLKNGQQLRFATQDTLTQFLQDPVRYHAFLFMPVLSLVMPAAAMCADSFSYWRLTENGPEECRVGGCTRRRW